MDTLLPNSSETYEKELFALSRMLIYARDTARSIQAQNTEHCIEMALQAVALEIQQKRGDYGFIASDITNGYGSLQ